ncbi:MAG: hypothetical protein DMG65_21490 [Candidatus Angelobacter sp. Gp1-AA117]|nr:MAG: hypothetical protein DMG65_21490 [Candidatus Angelobacter sp. Gp1-AA117]
MSSRPASSTIQPGPSSSSFLSALVAWSLIILLAALAIYELKPPNPLPATASQDEFSAERALAHVRAIARVPHPIGTSANAEARAYILAQFTSLGMNPQVAPAIGTRKGNSFVVVANAQNIVGRLPGTANSQAILLMAHYDSVPSGPGAADDASGVAAILEAVRALRTGPALKNDLIVLITDGEEVGLLGAEGFVASHPWMKDVGLVINFEARGDDGPSLLFETSNNNAPLIKEVVHAAPYPTASSLFYALYKLLPNDTDVTVFKRTNTPALNFAFGGHLEAYHSSLDTADHLSTASLQHHGSYALALARRFGQMDVSQLRQGSGDDVFFDWFGTSMVAYSQSWVIIGEIVVTILLVLTILLSTRRTGMSASRLVPALFASLGLLILVPIVMAAVAWVFLFLLRGRLILGDVQSNALLFIGLVALGAAVASATLAKFRKRFTALELALSGLVLVCILSWALALLLPAGSYVLFWPLLFSILGLLLLVLPQRPLTPGREWRAALLGTLFTILLFAPLSYLLYVFLTISAPSVALVGLLLGLAFLICIPAMDVAVPPGRSQKVVLLLMSGAVICMGIGIVESHSSGTHPRRDHLLYSVNTDDQTAVWASYDPAPDRFTAQFITDKAAKSQPLPKYLPTSQRRAISAPAPVVSLQPPVAEIKADEKNGDLHTLRMTVRSQRDDADSMVLRFEGAVQPVSIKISGRDIVPNQTSSDLTLVFYGVGTKGADLDLTIKAPSGISFWLGDQSLGLPDKRPRPENLMPTQGSDETIVCRKYTLAGTGK